MEKNQLSFYHWPNVNINGNEYSIFAIEEDLEKAKAKVLLKVKDKSYAEKISIHMNTNKPVLFVEPHCFILGTRNGELLVR
jgi:hypothetical protein